MIRRKSYLFLFALSILVVFQLYRTLLTPPGSPMKESNKNPSLHVQTRDETLKESLKGQTLHAETKSDDSQVDLEKQRREDEETMKRFKKRLEVLKSRCPGWRASSYKSNWVTNKNFLINQKRHILVCAVPKAGSSSWHMTIWAMRRQEAGLDPDTKYYTYNDTVYNHAIAGKLTTAEGRELILYNTGDDDLTKDPPTEKTHRLILARHPFARLISGWHQKFLPGASYADFLFKAFPQIKAYMRDKDPDHRMAWTDFARYIAGSAGQTQKHLDYHFTTAQDLCKPCQYAYTYILKAESVDKDESWLQRRLNITDVNVGRKGVPPGGSLVNTNPSDNIKKYMAQLNDDVRRRLYLVYKEDFEMFGYTFNFHTLESGGFD